MYNGEKVSGDHLVVLKEYQRKYDAVAQLNEGRRNLADQWRFWNHYRRYGRPLAAYPTPSAPHIKWGRNNHALDINAGVARGQAQHVAAFYRSLGVSVSFNVRGEPWHMDVLDGAALRRAANKIRAGRRVLRMGSKGDDVKELQKNLRAVGRFPFKVGTRFGPRTFRALKKYQRSQKIKADGIYGPTTKRHLEADARRARARR